MLTALLFGGSNPVAGGGKFPIYITRSDGESLGDFHARVAATIVRLKTIPGNGDATYNVTMEEK